MSFLGRVSVTRAVSNDTHRLPGAVLPGSKTPGIRKSRLLPLRIATSPEGRKLVFARAGVTISEAVLHSTHTGQDEHNMWVFEEH
jgi:hypothetical protein